MSYKERAQMYMTAVKQNLAFIKYEDDDQPTTEERIQLAQVSLASAQVEATLELADQTRISNILALAALNPSNWKAIQNQHFEKILKALRLDSDVKHDEV